jgi:hypothetical protein
MNQKSKHQLLEIAPLSADFFKDNLLKIIETKNLTGFILYPTGS